MPDIDKLFEDAPESAGYSLQATEGRVPEELRGTFFRAGPGIQRVGDRRLHPLDGYGFIAGVSFERGQAMFRARHVRTPAFERERKVGRQLHRRPFTNKPSRWSNFADLTLAEGANHDVLVWGDQVVATDAPGHRSLDPRTLETHGPAPTQRLRTHRLGTLAQMPRPDLANDRLVTFATSPQLGSTRVIFSELDRTWNVVTERSYSLAAPGVVLHDLAFTPKHYLSLEVGRLRLGTALWGQSTFYDALGPARGDVRHVYLFDRTREGPGRALPLPPGSQAFHFFNAFVDERRDNELVFDLVLYAAPVDFGVFGPAESVREVGRMAELHPVIARCRLAQGSDTLLIERFEGAHGEAPCVNPALHGRRHRFGYFCAETERGDESTPGAYFYFHGVGAIDFETGQVSRWSAGPRRFCSPPAFVARPGGTAENDGWLLVWTLDAEREAGAVVLLDAARVADGPVAVLPLQHALPAVSHVDFSPDTVFSGTAAATAGRRLE